MNKILKDIKKIFILLIGITILLIGLALLILPGPGILTIILGLVILASEFIWAKRLLMKLKKQANVLQKRTVEKVIKKFN